MSSLVLYLTAFPGVESDSFSAKEEVHIETNYFTVTFAGSANCCVAGHLPIWTLSTCQVGSTVFVLLLTWEILHNNNKFIRTTCCKITLKQYV